MSRDGGWIQRLRIRAPGLLLRGLCMGAADVVPGVSGGTIALITGVYDELVGTIAGIDTEVGRLLLRGRIGEALQRSNAAFLVPLVGGILTSIASLTHLITYLLVHYPQPVWGFFTGLILSSALFVGRQVGTWRAAQLMGLGSGILGGVAITSLVPVQTGPEMYKFFLAGMVAIVAMILPGISGSFLLVILGKYQQVFAAVDQHRPAVLASFGAGCVVGLLLFSRLLKALLTRFHATTLAFLVGLMLGSLRRVWPFREVLEQRAVGDQMIVIRDQCVWPHDLGPVTLVSLGLLAAGVALVLILEHLGRRVR